MAAGDIKNAMKRVLLRYARLAKKPRASLDGEDLHHTLTDELNTEGKHLRFTTRDVAEVFNLRPVFEDIPDLPLSLKKILNRFGMGWYSDKRQLHRDFMLFTKDIP